MPQSILDYISALEDEVKKEKDGHTRFHGLVRLSRAFFLYGNKHGNHEAIDWAIHNLKEASKLKNQYLSLPRILVTLNSIKEAGLYEKVRKEILESSEANNLSKIYKTLEERKKRNQRQHMAEDENLQELRNKISMFMQDFRNKAELWGLKDYGDCKPTAP